MIAYLESSAAVKLILREPESDALRDFLRQIEEDEGSVVSSALLETELRRAATRGGASQAAATAVLDRLEVLDVERTTFRTAGILPGHNLRSLDALHVAVALQANAVGMISYDKRQITTAETVGLHVYSPA